MICEKCGIEHDGTYGSGRFCSSKCARSYASSHVTKDGRMRQKQALLDKSNRDKLLYKRLSQSKNYELKPDGTWNKIPKNKKDNSEKEYNHSVVLGKIGELITAQKFLAHGYKVFIPLVDISGVDMIVEKDNGPIKVQVKSSTISTSVNNENTQFSLRSSNFTLKNGSVVSYSKRYNRKSVDYFALYSEIDNDVYLIKNNLNQSTFTIRKGISDTNRITRGKNLEKIHRAEDYQIDKVLTDIDKNKHK